ncbi:MAG: hypothetical protein ACT4PY_15075 [Armatimonadota bacterium]
MAKVATRTSLPLPGRKVTYVCHNCGQSWEEVVVPGRTGTYAVVKAGIDPAPPRKPGVSKLLPYLHSKWFSRQEMLGAGSALGLATGLATMSSAGPELAARQGWVASFLLAGFLLAAACYVTVSAARRSGGPGWPR